MADVTDHGSTARRRLAWPRPIRLVQPLHRALAKQAEERADDFGNRLADTITRFAGSMTFVYLHIVWFASWIGFGVETIRTGC